jgi:hypothetical protein
VYDAYQADLDKLNVQLGQVIKAYAAAYRTDTLTNDKAQGLMDEVLKKALLLEDPERLFKKGRDSKGFFGSSTPSSDEAQPETH